MCGGFKFLKNALICLNILYILVAFILIGVATYGKAASLVTSLPIIGGIVACGVFLLMIALLGLVGTVKHSQVLLFFYMVVLFILFIIQFSIACACLAVDDATRRQLALKGWDSSSNQTRKEVEDAFKCCGFLNSTLPSPDFDLCLKNNCNNSTDSCPTCDVKLDSIIRYGFRISGGMGLFFSFTEILGFSVAYRFRNIPAGMNEVM